jgi:hypothetical protein
MRPSTRSSCAEPAGEVRRLRFYDVLVSLHRVDPRFVLPHAVRRAVVLDDLEEWRTGFLSAGVEVVPAGRYNGADVVVTPARLAESALRIGAPAVIVEGSRGRTFDTRGYTARRFVLRPTRERPSLALPIDQPAAVSYAVESWSVVDRRWKAARMRGARLLLSRGFFPAWASPIVTIGMHAGGAPAMVAAARDFGVPDGARWFLTFGQGDALSRNAFHLFRVGSERPEWVLKFARVAGYAKRFDNDERGLRLAREAGPVVAAHVPRILGRFVVDGVHASLETAAAGRRLRDFLRTPGERGAKLRLIDQIAAWIVELGALTQQPPEAMAAELERLRREIVPKSVELGADAALVDELTQLRPVVQHNDLGTWNVVADGDRFAIVDWEDAREAASPLWDLLYFLADAFVLLDAPDTANEGPERLPERIVRLFAGEAPSSRRLFSWVRRATEAAAVPADVVGAVATLCWLSHSASADSHNLDLASWTPRDPPRLHGLEGMGRAWMTHPALGPRWSVWRE